MKGLSNPTCFVAGTVVLTATGFAAIETIAAGDRVISTNPETGETTEKRVVETYVRKTMTLVHLMVGKGILHTTVDHPFYVKGRGFLAAAKLIVGDILLDSHGGELQVENMEVELQKEPITVYNFQVEDFHTYHVGRYGVLVHNAEYGSAGGSSSVRELMLQSENAKKWGVLEDGTNQGVKHFADYWEKYPERIPSLEQRLGVNAGDFNNSLEGFENFTKQAGYVIDNATANGNVRNVSGKTIYYMDGVANPKKGVIVIVKDGKIQSMMPSDFKSFNKLQ